MLWHVDDLKISQVDTMVVDGVIKQLNQRYGKGVPPHSNQGGGSMNTRGRVHEYLRMNIYFS